MLTADQPFAKPRRPRALEDFPNPLEPAGNHELIAHYHFANFAVGASEPAPTHQHSAVFIFGVASRLNAEVLPM